MMDKGSEYLGKGRSNGTKSPSNASNGHFSDESGSDDEHGEYSLEQPRTAPCVCVCVRARFRTRKTFEPNASCVSACGCFPDVGMRVGADYQANIPEFEPGEMFFPACAGVTDGGSLGTWSPFSDGPEPLTAPTDTGLSGSARPGSRTTVMYCSV